MSRSRLAPAILILAAAACLAFGATAPAQPEKKGAGPREPALDQFVAKAVEPDAKDTPLRKLQKERTRERAVAIALIKKVMETGSWAPAYFSDYIKLQVTLAENLAELMDKPEDRVKCYEMRVEALKEAERFTRIRVEAGNEVPQNLNIARAARIDAEIELLKLKEAPKGGK